MTPEHIQVIARLRVAAKQFGEVADLLEVINSALLIDEAGNREIIADADEIEYLQAAMLAHYFVEFDRKKEAG